MLPSCSEKEQGSHAGECIMRLKEYLMLGINKIVLLKGVFLVICFTHAGIGSKTLNRGIIISGLELFVNTGGNPFIFC